MCAAMRMPLFAIAPLPPGAGSRDQLEYIKLLREALYLTPVVHTPTTDWPTLRAKRARQALCDSESE